MQVSHLQAIILASLTRPQIVPHVTTAIQDWIERVSKIPVDNTGEEPDVCIVEMCMLPPNSNFRN